MTLREVLAEHGLEPEDVLEVEIGKRSDKGVVVNVAFSASLVEVGIYAVRVDQ